MEPEAVGSRVDIFVSQKYPQFARSALAVLFDTNSVLVNGATVKAGEKLREGDTVSVDEAALFNEPELIELPVIYEDENVVVVNKPAGILTHSKGSLNQEGTVATFIKSKINDENLSGNRAGIVHRLDRATSGVMIAVKNAQALLYLQKQFSQRKTKKTYYTIVEGWPNPEKAMIDAPIERNPKKPQTFKVGTGGKTAQTNYKILKKFTKEDKEYALLELNPVTGRTHQLRVHLSYIEHPIVGDGFYGRPGNYTYLHAGSLEITLPGGVRKIFTAPLPKIFKEFQENE